MSPEDFASLLSKCLGWTPTADDVTRWELVAVPPGDVLLALDRLKVSPSGADGGSAGVILYRDLLPIADEAVAWAADIMRSRPPGALTSKGDRDIASALDYEIERGLRTRLRATTPGIGFLGEEEGSTGSAEVRWVLDPIDGTANFVRGIPLCAVSLGLLQGTEAVLGAIELPFLGSRYKAAKGVGAYVDGRPIRVRDTRLLSQAIVAIGDYAVGPGAEAKNHLRLALTRPTWLRRCNGFG
ncbi:inositol monophosphatase family protein [Micromonospora echinospora]|uniref:inositol monophosphatase family protein n=1 Tax=Micromonospora echinospora TaxID=1877 RepID=UPI003A888AD2